MQINKQIFEVITKMEAVSCSEMPIITYKTAWCKIWKTAVFKLLHNCSFVLLVTMWNEGWGFCCYENLGSFCFDIL